MDWTWFLSGLSILLNIVSIVILFQCKKLNNQDETQKEDDAEAIHQSMEAFVTKMERENDALYQKLVTYIKGKENEFNKRVRLLEEKLEGEVTSPSVLESTSNYQVDVKQSNSHHPSDKDQEQEKISQLYKQGFSPKQIAKVLQMDHGKVELIINMLKKTKLSHVK